LAVFLVSKFAALFFFLLISGYHFGEQHLMAKYRGPFAFGIILFLVYGLAILFLLFYLQVEEVVLIFGDITDTVFQVSFFQIGLYGLSTALVLLFAFACFRGFLKVNPILELFLFLVFFIVFQTASLVWAFCIYFIVWHSLPSLYDQLNFLYGNTNKSSMLKYLRSSLPYWFLSIAGVGLLYLIIGNRTDYFITVVLYVLAGITFPHVLVMSRIGHLKSNNL
jgi:Brp/Blh family beta-carotene 15,15'-monooxygenase